MTIDTLAFTKHLIEKGHFRPEQAEAIAEAQRDYVQGDLAVKQDVTSARNDLSRDITAVKNELKRDIKEVRDELKRDIEEVRDELKRDIEEVRDELKRDIEGVREDFKRDIDGLSGEVKRDIGDVREEMARGFEEQTKQNELLRTELLQTFDVHQRRVDMKLQELSTNIWKVAFVAVGATVAGVGLLIKLL